MMRDATGRIIAVGDRVAVMYGSCRLKLGVVVELLPKTARVELDKPHGKRCIPYEKCCVYETAQVRMVEVDGNT